MSIQAARFCCLFAIFPLVVHGISWGQDDPPKKPAVLRAGKLNEAEMAGALPKYADMELPSTEEFLKAKPFDWIVLKNQDVLVVEPIGPRPDTLVRLASEYERYSKGRAGMVEGDGKLKEKRRQLQRIQLTLLEPGQDQDPDYQIETKLVLKIEYFEDLVLQRTNLLIDEGKVPLAYDLLLFVDRRHRENNQRLSDAYKANKEEEAAARIDEERVRISVPELPALKLSKTWPRFDETYHRLLFKDAEIRTNRGEHESAIRLLENLWDHNPAFSSLSERFGQVIDLLVTDRVEKSDFRQARHFLGRLTARDSQHPIAAKWKTELINRTTTLIEEARAAASTGNASLGARLVNLAARVWPDTPGLKDVHRELVDRFQSVRVGVLRLPGEPTNYPFDPPAETNMKAMTNQLLFEPIRVDERSVRYRSSILDSWEPTDLGRQVQFTLRLKRADWEARPLITSADIFNELAAKIDPHRPTYDERLGGLIERVAVTSPSQFTVHFRRLPLRLEALLQFTVPLSEESWALNTDLDPDASSTGGGQRFFESERDEDHVAFRRVRPQPSTTKARNIDEIVEVRYDTWERALQSLMRGEITGISHAALRDVKPLQDDTRFFVVPYALPLSHFIVFNPTSAPLRDGQLRRALSMALPREELLKRSFLLDSEEPYARTTSTLFPTTSYGHNRLLAEPIYDPQRAAALAMTAKKQQGGKLPDLRLTCPPDAAVRAAATLMIEHWRRVGITVQLIDDVGESKDESVESKDIEWDMAYQTTKIIEPLTELAPILSNQSDAKVESLRPLPERVRRQLLELERINEWTAATKLIHRIETELLVEARFVALWEVDEFLVTRNHLRGLPPKLMHTFQDVERWTLQSWYPQEAP